MFRITYNISKVTNLEARFIIPKIHCRLSKSGYTITREEENKIEFENSFWQIGSRTKMFQKVDGGTFQVFKLENETKIVFSYYISFDPVIALGVFISLASLIFDYNIIFFVIVLGLIQLLRVDNVKSLGIKMLYDLSI